MGLNLHFDSYHRYLDYFCVNQFGVKKSIPGEKALILEIGLEPLITSFSCLWKYIKTQNIQFLP